MRDKNYINSVDRALRILEILGESPQPLTLTEVANSADLTKTTTQRFINTLTCLGYVNREENKRYFLGTKVLSLGFQFLDRSKLTTIVKPYLEELSSETEMTVNLAVLDYSDVLILHRREVRKFLKYDVHPGSKLLAYGSALGLVLMAGFDDQEIYTRLNAMDIRQLTPKTVTSRDIIMKQIVKTRKLGYAISDQEQSMDLCSIAVPILNKQKETLAAINVSMDVMRRNNPEIVEKARTQLFEKGDQISQLQGYVGPYPRIFVKNCDETQDRLIESYN